MPVEERRRLALRQQVAATWGEEAADTLFDLVSPAGSELATRADVAGLRSELDRAVERLEHRFALQDEHLGAAISDLGERFERRIADAVTTQTRTLVLSQLGALVVIAGLAFGLR